MRLDPITRILVVFCGAEPVLLMGLGTFGHNFAINLHQTERAEHSLNYF